MKTQTDWLKEFRQAVPLSSQLKLTGGARQTNGHTMTAPSAITHSQHLHHGTTPGAGAGSGMGMGFGNGLGGTSVGQSRQQRPPPSSSSGSTLLPNKPKLVLDSGNGVQLVHI